MNEIEEAMNVLRKNMQDEAEGELYHAWMCNIKFAVYDSLMQEFYAGKLTNQEIATMLNGCEKGAKLFLNRLFKET